MALPPGQKAVVGGPELWQKFKRMNKSIEGKVAALVTAAANETERVAKQLAPVDSGILRDSIKQHKVADNYRIVYADAEGKRHRALAANVTEFGRENHPYPLDPRPFIRAAQTLVAEQFQRKFRKLIRDSIKREFPSKPGS